MESNSKLRTARSLVQRLSSAPTDAIAAESIAEIRRRSKNDPDVRSPLADAGAVPLLAAYLHPHPLHPIPPSAASDAAAALLNLSIAAPHALMSTPALLDALAAALRAPDAAANAAATLYSLLTVDAYRPIIGSKKSLVSALVAILRDPDAPSRTTKDALKALFGLALYPLNRATLVELGAVPALFDVVARRGRRSGVAEDATAVIAQVAGCCDSVEAFRRAGGVAALVDLVGGGGGGRARENAAAALLSLVMSGGEEAAEEVRVAEGAVEAVRELAGGGEGVTERGKGKAEALLRVLERRRCSFDEYRYSLTQLFSISDASTSSDV